MKKKKKKNQKYRRRYKIFPDHLFKKYFNVFTAWLALTLLLSIGLFCQTKVSFDVKESLSIPELQIFSTQFLVSWKKKKVGHGVSSSIWGEKKKPNRKWCSESHWCCTKHYFYFFFCYFDVYYYTQVAKK